jgi:hypothetical protein
MQRNGPILLLVAALLAAASPSAHDLLQHTGGRAPTDNPGKAVTTDAVETGKEGLEQQVRSEKELARLYEGFFGKPAQAPASSNPGAVEAHEITFTSSKGRRSTWKIEWDAPEEPAQDPKEILDRRRAKKDCRPEFMIALVPDPLDSSLAISFDQAISAIQLAFAEEKYLPDRFWLPWRGEAAKAKAYRDNPGIMLFRNEGDPVRCLSTLFLVGETPKLGIQKEAFRQAVALIDKLTGRPQQTLNVLGPSFSGSIASLEALLEGYLSCSPRGRCRVDLATGSASSQALGRLSTKFHLAGFRSKVTESQDLIDRSLGFLHRRMGWSRGKIALLYESDTTYGQIATNGLLDKLVRIPFPSGLSEMREAWEEKDGPGEDLRAGSPKLGIPRLTLDLSLAERAEPGDTITEFSHLTTRNKDLAIANILTAISRGGQRYIGILATDPRDTIFLARRIKTFAPDVILFTIDNNLLYTHPTYQEFTDEMLVLANYPLFTEGDRWRELLGGPGTPCRYRRQFMTEFQQGIFEAALSFLQTGKAPPCRDQSAQERIWISAIGNGSLWPLASLPKARGLDDEIAHPPAPPGGKKIIQLIYLALLTAALGWQVCRLSGRLLPALAEEHRIHGLLAAGMIPPWIMGALLLTVGTLSSQEYTLRAALVTLASGLYILLLWTIARERIRPAKLPYRPWLPWLLGVPIVSTLPWTLHWLWMPGGAGLFQMRVSYFSSGLSPMVSLLFLGSAILAWAFWELKRRGLQIQQGFAWPLQDWRSMTLFGCRDLADGIQSLLDGTSPPRSFWLLFGVPLAPVACYLLSVIQPVAETRWYGAIFALLILLGFTLATISFFRFLSLWWILRRVLERIDHTPIPDALRRISAKIAWKPMKSFAWPLPVFKMAALSVEQLEAVSRRPEYRGLSDAHEAWRRLEEVFAAHQKRSFAEEARARKALSQALAEGGEQLRHHVQDPAVAAFFAVRLAAYLRNAFAHMRYCLIGTMTAAGLLLMAIRTYAFEPKQHIFMCVWALLLGAVVLIFYVFFEMDRNGTLSAINGTNAGEISFDRTFFGNLLTYGVIPLLGLAATQFPQIGRYFVGWLNPLLRVVGGN